MTDPEKTEQERAVPGVNLAETVAGSREGAASVQTLSRRGKVFELEDVTVSYAGKPAVSEVSMPMYKNAITALIGPSGCGKSTLIRCLNRMNDLIPSASVDGSVLYHGENIYATQVDPVEVRKRIGMVFQKPNPFPEVDLRQHRLRAQDPGHEGRTWTRSSRRRCAAPRSGTRSRTGSRHNAFGMSGGQQQRLCIARCLAVDPDVILMDEPCSALDPISTGKIEDLMLELKKHYSIVIVTHNMQQAARVSDMTAFLIVKLDDDEKHRQGRLVEYDVTEKIFTNPSDQRTEDYVTGKVG